MRTAFDNGGYVGYVADYGNPPVAYATNGLVMHLDAGNTASYAGSGAVWKDLTGTVADGTLYNSPTYSSSNGGYFAFNGSNQYATWPNTAALDNQSFSIEVWMKTNSTGQNGFWFEKGAVNTQYSFFLEGGLIRFRINGGDYTSPTASTYLNTTSWFQMVGTFTSGSANIYANKAVIGTATPSLTMNANANGISVGAYGGTSAKGYYYNGNIAIVRVYSRVLSTTEITQNYDAHKTRFGL